MQMRLTLSPPRTVCLTSSSVAEARGAADAHGTTTHTAVTIDKRVCFMFPPSRSRYSKELRQTAVVSLRENAVGYFLLEENTAGFSLLPVHAVQNQEHPSRPTYVAL
jgi:hypothetical protein